MNRNKREMYVEKRNDIIKTFAFDKHTEGSDKDEITLFVCCGRDINYSIVNTVDHD